MMDGFSQSHHVQGRASIADLFPPGKRCGLYILQFSDGEIYAGQALDVTRRYVQHCKVHCDIEKMSFKRVSKNKLNEEERALIWRLEHEGHRLRNITFTSIPRGESDFDLIMSAEEQERWLKDISYVDLSGSRVVDPELRRKYSRKFQHFAAMPRSDEIMNILRGYVHAAIPTPLRSELSFWACSCLPAYSQPKVTIYSRINLNWQEVFTTSEYKGELEFSFHLALSPLEEAFGESLSLLEEKFPFLEATENFYEPGGQDQINLIVQGADSAKTFMQQREIISAMRLFNLRLMKKGACIYSRYHCMDLADRLIRTNYEILPK
ncbi:MAG: hypothetical protein H0X15_10675 [Acidobacteria bacterium]|jgi:hypothetical protein|nr:hypothetical protein [Acidobacteriota bacterium]